MFRNAYSILFLLIIFGEVFIIDVSNGISESPTTRRSPFYTLLQTGFEAFQHIILCNKCHRLVEVILN